MRQHRHSILVAVAVGTMAAACGHNANQNAGREPIRVRAVEVQRATTAGGVEYVGVIEESAAANVAFEAGGRVLTLPIREGQRVAKGQLVATIDTATAAAAYRAAKATLERAEDAYNRARQVHENGVMAEMQWVEIRSQVEQARASEAIARRALDNCRLMAPMDGVVSARLAEVGSVVAPGQAVVRIVNIDRTMARIDVPEVDISRVRIGDRCQVSVNSATDSALYDGRVEERSVEADALTHSYRVRVGVRRPVAAAQSLLPGMVCRVRFGGVAAGAGYTVPRRAVQIDAEGQRFIWVVDSTGAAHRSYVSIADMTEGGVVVEQGLRDGDVVVTDGMLKLNEGTAVQVISRKQN